LSNVEFEFISTCYYQHFREAARGLRASPRTIRFLLFTLHLFFFLFYLGFDFQHFVCREKAFERDTRSKIGKSLFLFLFFLFLFLLFPLHRTSTLTRVGQVSQCHMEAVCPCMEHGTRSFFFFLSSTFFLLSTHTHTHTHSLSLSVCVCVCVCVCVFFFFFFFFFFSYDVNFQMVADLRATDHVSNEEQYVVNASLYSLLFASFPCVCVCVCVCALFCALCIFVVCCRSVFKPCSSWSFVSRTTQSMRFKHKNTSYRRR